MKSDIEFLEKLAGMSSFECDKDDHDCDNCIYCEARRELNEIGDIAWNAVKSIVKKMQLDKLTLCDNCGNYSNMIICTSCWSPISSKNTNTGEPENE